MELFLLAIANHMASQVQCILISEEGRKEGTVTPTLTLQLTKRFQSHALFGEVEKHGYIKYFCYSCVDL